jgi:hypothetical protein
MVSSGLASKPAATVFFGFASKPVAMVFSSLASKLVVTVSPDLTSKPAALSWASKSPRRFLGLGLKTNQTSVYRLRHKTDGGRSAWDTHRDLAVCFTWKQVCLGFFSLVHVAPLRRLRRRQVEDGRVDATCYVGPCYPIFAVFNVLDPSGIVVI